MPRRGWRSPGLLKPPSAPGRWLAVHPGSGSESKNWPEAKWLELLRHSCKPRRCICCSSAARRSGAGWSGWNRRSAGTRIKLMQSAPLPELAQWLASCIAFVGHDSGISHLAAAVGVRSLILWGDSVEAVWRPRGRDLTIFRDAGGLGRSVRCRWSSIIWSSCSIEIKSYCKVWWLSGSRWQNVVGGRKCISSRQGIGGYLLLALALGKRANNDVGRCFCDIEKDLMTGARIASL